MRTRDKKLCLSVDDQDLIGCLSEYPRVGEMTMMD